MCVGALLVRTDFRAMCSLPSLRWCQFQSKEIKGVAHVIGVPLGYLPARKV